MTVTIGRAIAVESEWVHLLSYSTDKNRESLLTLCRVQIEFKRQAKEKICSSNQPGWYSNDIED